MAVTLDQQEIDEFLRDGHTVIVTTIGPGGFPHSIPLWYAYLDGKIYFRKLRKSQGVLNITRDNRVSCLVETGERWIDLKAVMIRGRAVEVTDEQLLERFTEENERKYAAFRSANTALPERTRQHYAQERVFYRVEPERKTVSWWNQKIRLRPAAPAQE